MLKQHKSLKGHDSEGDYGGLFREVLHSLPVIERVETIRQPRVGQTSSWRPDMLFEIEAGGKTWNLVCEVKTTAQPRHVRIAALQLKDFVAREFKRNAYGVLLAQYVSPESANICAEAGIGFADLAGNCRLSFDHVYVERSGRNTSPAVRRELRSLFAPKSARILRLLLGSPHRAWKGVELASKAQVSLGHVSNVRNALLDREWVREDNGGILVSNPVTVLFAWRDAYARSRTECASFHTLLHGSVLDAAVGRALLDAGRGEHAILASYSAANWLAPFGRSSTAWFYADAKGEAVLRKQLKLEPAGSGGNVSIGRMPDKGIFIDRIEPAPNVWTTGLIQTYLDLFVSGERGAEAADHLLTQKIAATWKEG